MSYEINVSLNGKHFFATAERSLRDEAEARMVFAALKSKFPESDGFKVECSEKVAFSNPVRGW